MHVQSLGGCPSISPTRILIILSQDPLKAHIRCGIKCGGDEAMSFSLAIVLPERAPDVQQIVMRTL